MKIVFTGGGSGGHFYPIIAVAEALNDIARDRKLIEPQLYYAAPEPYDREMLVANNISFVAASAGKVRRYNSAVDQLLNFFDYFKTAWGVARSVLRIFFLYPDVIFSTGGYAAFPTLLAARLFNIPVVLLNCDASPGRVNAWAAKFARKIAIAFAEAGHYFPANKVAHTGNPVRKAALVPAREGAREYWKLSPDMPVILVTGGSQGSVTLNDAVVEALPRLLEHSQIIHQTGEANLAEVQSLARVAMGEGLHADRYKPVAYLNDVATRMAAGAADLIISRAGAGNIFEAASWGVPAILVPIPEPLSHDQTKNAYAYARAGAAVVVEQQNLTTGVFASEIERVMGSKELLHAMQNAARAFARPDAAKTIAEAILDIALSHEE